MRMSSLPKSTAGPQDGVGEAGLDQRPLELGLAAEILQRRVLGRVGDADVDDPLDAGLLGGREQSERVAHGVGVGEQAMVEPHPVGVVEDRAPRQVLRQQVRLVEMEGKRPDAVAERIGPARRVGQRDDRCPASSSRWAMYLPEYPKAPVTT